MSRVGRAPVVTPQNVEVTIDGNLVKVKGPKGELSKQLHQEMELVKEEGQIVVKRPTDQKRHRELHGLTRALLNNMVKGVSEGFSKKLELNGVGYRAAKQGKKLVLTVGYSHPVEIEPEAGLEIEVPAPNQIVVSGIDKEKVGELAANIRKVRPPEPYKGKGIKYADERIKRKEGKTGA